MDGEREAELKRQVAATMRETKKDDIDDAEDGADSADNDANDAEK